MPLRQSVAGFLELPLVRNTIIGIILFNAVLLGVETFPAVMDRVGGVVHLLDAICLAVFVAELAAKLFAHGLRYFRDPWNVFDFLIVGISLAPNTQGLSVLRALRILRVLRVLSIAPRLRRVVEGFLEALPGMASVFMLLGILFYIGAVMATKLFGADFPAQFGNLAASTLTLFQVMTLEGWADGVVRPVMVIYPYAWLFFIPFMLVTTFAVLNLLIGLVVNSMQDAHGAEGKAEEQQWRDAVLAKLEALERRVGEAGKG